EGKDPVPDGNPVLLPLRHCERQPKHDEREEDVVPAAAAHVAAQIAVRGHLLQPEADERVVGHACPDAVSDCTGSLCRLSSTPATSDPQFWMYAAPAARQ